MELDLRSNLREVMRGVEDAKRNQVPYAVSVAINETLAAVKDDATDLLKSELDNPTPFTLRAFAVRRSSKRHLAGAVFAKSIQEGYLAWAEEGGRRRPRGRALVVPQAIRTNAHGNMARGAVRRALAGAGVFSAGGGDPRTAHLAPGIYRRPLRGVRKDGSRGTKGAGLTMLVAYEAAADYKPRLGFKRRARRLSEQMIDAAVARALARAFATARP